MRKLALFVVVLMSLGATGYSADFFCASGNIGCLISAINVSNGNGQDNDIALEAGEYTLLGVDNLTEGPNGLPSITGRMRIHGPDGIGSTIERSPTAPNFRLFQISAVGDLLLDWLGIRNGRIERKETSILDAGGAISSLGRLSISRCAIYNNLSDFVGGGGAIYSTGSLSISHSDVGFNIAGDTQGGAIYSLGSLLIEDSFLFKNQSESGGALRIFGTGFITRTTISGNSAVQGGGIENFGTLWIENSSIHDNGASNGGIYNAGRLTIESSTVSNNSILNDSAGSLLLKNATVGSSVGILNRGVSRVQNSILASANGCARISSLGNNVFASLNGCTLRDTDRVGDPGLGPFTEDPLRGGNGHFPLASGSSAINGGSDGACPPEDQISTRRVGICDIGAVEFHPRRPAR